MRLHKYIIKEDIDEYKWNDIRELIEGSCQPYLRYLKNAKTLLYRGLSHSPPPLIAVKTVRQNRKPRFLSPALTELLNKWSKRHWGFGARKESLFVSNSSKLARNYGRVGIIFPAGDFKYAWNKNIHKLYVEYDRWDINVRLKMTDLDISKEEAEEKTFEKTYIPHLKEYKTTNLNSYLKGQDSQWSECIINCKSYFIVNEEWNDMLLHWYTDRYWKER